jgi:hypothetical protein
MEAKLGKRWDAIFDALPQAIKYLYFFDEVYITTRGDVVQNLVVQKEFLNGEMNKGEVG